MAVHHLTSIRQCWRAAYFETHLGDQFSEVVREFMSLVDRSSGEIVRDTSLRLGVQLKRPPQLIADVTKHLLGRQILATDITQRTPLPLRPWSAYQRVGNRTEEVLQ